MIDEHSIAKAVTAEASIDKTCQRMGMSQAGSQWLRVATDPFSDEPEGCTGFPDLITSKSVVQRIRRTMNISRPASVPATDNWDLHMSLNPYANAHTFGNAVLNAQNNMDTNLLIGAAGLKGGLEAYSGPAGTLLGSGALAGFLAIPDNFLKTASWRVISSAFELHNTTSKLHQQGSLIVYRQICKNTTDHAGMINMFNSTNALQKGAAVVNYDQGIYQSAADVLQQPDSKQWNAADGCYCVATMNSQVNQPIEFENQGFLLVDPTTVGGYIASSVSADANNILNIQRAVAPAPFNYAGAYLTGLSPETTIQADVVWYVEAFPTTQQTPELVVLGSNSAAYDGVALEAYAALTSKMPPGVKVKDNASADWISAIAKTLGNLGVPGMGIVSDTLAPVVGKWVDDTFWPQQNVQNTNQRKPRKKKVPAKTTVYQLPPPVTSSETISVKKTKPGRNRMRNQNKK